MGNTGKKRIRFPVHSLDVQKIQIFAYLARLYESTERAIALPPASVSALSSVVAKALKMLKFYVKVFKPYIF